MSEPLDTAILNFEREFADIFGHRVSTKHAYRLVRGVISDIREPSEAMVDAGGVAFFDEAIAHEHGDKTNRPFVRFWRSMIDAALK